MSHIRSDNLIRMGIISISLAAAGCMQTDLSGSNATADALAEQTELPISGQGTGFITDTYTFQEVPFAILGDYAVMDNDMILGSAEELLTSTVSLSFVKKGYEYRWPKGVVPYEIVAGHPYELDIEKQMNVLMDNTTGITFERYDKTNPDHITYLKVNHKYVEPITGKVKYDVCMADLGYKPTKVTLNIPHQMYIGDGCQGGVTLHELGHVLGLWHEQQRGDRDDYVTIYPERIQPETLFNFVKITLRGIKIGAYDYGSIMHYPRSAFPIVSGDTTIEPKDPSIAIGQRFALSVRDAEALNFMYNKQWEFNTSYNPPVTLTSGTAASLGRRFIDMDSDGDLDLVYNRIRADGSRDKAAWLNTGTGWERAPVAMDPPLATHKGALGADYGGRYVDVDGDGDLDMLYGYKDGLGRVTKHAFLYVDKDNDGRNDSWVAATEYNPPVLVTYYAGDVGRVFVDIGSIDSTGAFTNVLDGRLDIITRRLNTAANTTDIAAWVNTASNVGGAAGSIWQRAPIGFNPPRETAHDGLGNTGYKMVDLDHDGRQDFAFHRRYANGSTVKVAYLNREAGWHCDAPINASDVSVHDSNCSAAFFERYGPPAQLAAVGLGDRGSRFIDINNDGKLDLVYHLDGSQKGAYLNGGLGIGWQPAPAFEPPVAIAKLGVDDYGRRFVDIDNDGRVDMLYNRLGITDTNVGAYLNKPIGWVSSENFFPPEETSVAGFGDVGKYFIDVNGDGLKDMIYSNYSVLLSKPFIGAYLNKIIP